MSDTLQICGLAAPRGQKIQTYLPVLDTAVKVPLTIVNGLTDGPTLLVTAGIHGGEYPGVAAAMEIGRDLEPNDINGCLIIASPVNVQSFWQRSAFVVPEDGRNLNREFPGDANGTLSQKTAFMLSHNFFPLADFYIDLHSGDIPEKLHPYVYYPETPDAAVTAKSRAIAQTLNMEFMVRSTATGGAYNYAASTGVPSLLLERGGAGMCRAADVAEYKKDLHNIMVTLGLITAAPHPCRYQPRDVANVIYLQNTSGGCWSSRVRSGKFVQKGGVLGELTDLFGQPLQTYRAEQDGIVLYVYAALPAPPDTVLVAYGKITDA